MAKKRRPTARRRAATPLQTEPTPGPGESVYFLDIPDGTDWNLVKALGAAWFRGLGGAYVGPSLPDALSPYRAKPYSWQEWMSNHYSGRHSATPAPPDPTTGQYVLREDQKADVLDMLMSRKHGAREYLNGSKTGVGKTVVTMAAVKRMARVQNVLIICPGPVGAVWRQHIKTMGDGGKNWAIINYQATKKMLRAPDSVLAKDPGRAKNLAITQKGVPRFAWDLVIRDEAHWCGNPESQQTRVIDKIIENPPGVRPAFCIDLSATAGEDPSKVSYLHRGLFWATGETPGGSITADGYVDWAQRHGFTVTRNGYGNALKWEGDPSELRRMSTLIYRSTPSWAVRRVPDWPEQQRVLLPVELTAAEARAYGAQWSEFRHAMKTLERERAKRLREARTDTERAAASSFGRMKGLAAQEAYRRKAAIIRAPGTAAWVAEMVAKGLQVSVPCQFHGTLDAVAEHLEKQSIPYATFTGKNRDDRENQRIAFQRGQVPVILYTTTEGISLHAGEEAVGGTTADRVSIVAEPRWSPKATLQTEGRAQRNGTSAPIYYPYAVDTTEERVLRTVLRGMKNMAAINDDPTAPFEGLAESLGLSRVFGSEH